MSLSFSPKLRTVHDAVEHWLQSSAHYALLLVALVAPFFFWPMNTLSQGHAKTFVAYTIVVVVMVVFSLFLLRVGTLKIPAPLVLGLWWLFIALALGSAMLSGDRVDALIGETVSVHTVAFLALLALLATVVSLVLNSKAIVMQFLVTFGVVGLLVQLWHTSRLFFGPEFLSLGVFTTPTTSLLGSFNDLALFSGLMLLLSIVSLVHLPLRGIPRLVLLFIIGLSLFLLAIVNFFLVWVFVGLFTLIVFLYSLTKDRLLADETTEIAATKIPRLVLVVLGGTCLIAGIFIVGGSYVGPVIGNTFGIQYLEVRPSFSATLDIGKAAYRDNHTFLGIGPNRFEDAWRLYKNPVINETLFWNTSFSSGSGYVPTLFVTTGVAGGLAFVAFLVAFFVAGYRMLLRSREADTLWYFTGTFAFAAAVYIWVMACLYVPGVSLLILGAFFTGLTIVAYGQLVPGSVAVVQCAHHRPRAFLLIGTVVIVIIGGIGLLFTLTTHLAAQNIYAQAGGTTDSAVVDAALGRAGALFNDDRFTAARVRVHLEVMRALMALPEPTPNDAARFEATAAEALRLANEAVLQDGSNPAHHLLLASVYGMWSIAGATSTARELAAASFARASELDPQNPEYALVEAQFLARQGDFVRARELVQAALRRKSNYVDAFYILSQIEGASGNANEALASARAVTTLEPQNPARHFEQGVLELSVQDRAAARRSFETAVALDGNFANARYLLALVYLEDGQSEDALALLRVVAVTNPDNTELSQLIAKIESGEAVPPALGSSAPVSEPSPIGTEDGVTTSEVLPETDVLSPVNPRARDEAEVAPSSGEDEEVSALNGETDAAATPAR